MLWTRDFEYTMEFMLPLMDSAALAATHQQANYILDTRPVVTDVGPGDEPVFQAKMVANLANFTANSTLFCSRVGQLWKGLGLVYAGPSFKDGLVYTPTPQSGYGFTDSILKSGHHLFDSVIHRQVLRQLVSLSDRWDCGAPRAMEAVAATIEQALAGALLWNETAGMYAPSSGNCAQLTDVWGSALALETGAVPAARADRIAAWLGTNAARFVQSGQVRHLPSPEIWPATGFWEWDAYQNGGFWGTPSGWVLPAVARTQPALARQMVRDAVTDARRNGLNEWKNSAFSTGYAAGELTVPTGGYEAFPTTGDWVGGAMNYGPNIGSVYRAAVLLLGSSPPPPPSPPTSPPGPAPANCSLTASWQFYAAAANATEVNAFVEAGDGTVVLTPGKNDGWKVATAAFHADWSIDFKYFTGDFGGGGGGGGGGGAPVVVHCTVHPDCLRIDCPRYTYTRIA